MEHPAYATDIWGTVNRNISIIKKNHPGKISRFAYPILKRQLFYMTFLDDGKNMPYESIAYNDSEHMDEYGSYAEGWAAFCNSGLAEIGNMSFSEFLKLPNWLADWLVSHWCPMMNAKDMPKLDNELDKQIKEAEKAINAEKNDPFKTYG